nr:RNA-dependent RNA polymerase [Berega mammarenavirus]
MDDNLAELRQLVVKYLSNDARLSAQKLCFLTQSEPRFLLIEGLKLLSLCIEVDSCQNNECEHNTDNKSVEKILYDKDILCPGLPFVVPDGFRFVGNTLILLECFIRSNSVTFQQKYDEDLLKLNSLKVDLQRVNITLIPLIDGRTSYYNSFMPEWACDRMKMLLFDALKFQQENLALFEESEYARLCESLSASGGKLSGIESMETLKDLRADHYSRLLEKCHHSINPELTPTEIKSQINLLYNTFRNKLQRGQVEKFFVKTDREVLLQSFSNLYDGIIDSKIDVVESLKDKFPTVSPILKFLHYNSMTGEQEQCASVERNPIIGLRSAFNKLKSLKILNTRRKLLLLIDTVILLKHIDLQRGKPGFKIRGEWMGSSFLSVNDRLVSHQATQRDLKRWLIRRLKSKMGRRVQITNVSLSSELADMLTKLISKCNKVFEEINLSFSSFDADLKHLETVDFEEMLSFSISGVTPTISYIKRGENEIPLNLRTFSTDNNDDYLMLSSLCLGIVNSMKTSSTVKLRQNAVGKDRYKIVNCMESYYQELKTVKGSFKLLYQKTGECSKCYAVNHSDTGEICSFYADPKRYFVPIFSHQILPEMVDVMMSWLIECVELKEQLEEVKSLLKMIVLLILCHPSKRAQKLLQGIRYLIMAFVSDYYHKDLLVKLKEELITETEFYLYRLLRSLLNIVLNASVQTMLNNRFKFILNVSYLCHFITKETPDRLTDQIKCFEKFIEPKVKFGSLFVNPQEEPSVEEKEDIISDIERFISKKLLDEELHSLSEPGICPELFSLMVSSFNSGLILKGVELKRGIKDPGVQAGCATALDLASNKSVVVNKYVNGERALDYDINKLTTLAVCQLVDVFRRKGKYLLNTEDYEYKIQEVISDLVLGKKKSDPSEVLDIDASDEFFSELKDRVHSVLRNYEDVPKGNLRQCAGPNTDRSLKHLDNLIDSELSKKLILGELSVHLVEDFDKDTFTNEWYEEFCNRLFNNEQLRSLYSFEALDGMCPIDKMSQAVTHRTYMSGDYFQCFKSVLLQMDANRLAGKYTHYKNSTMFNFNYNKLAEDTRISERESNSQALSNALSLTKCTSSALKNLCFYSQESPQSFTSSGPDTGRLKFALSYKEQVGGNRELYIGDLRTKMFTRLIEDYFEAYTNQFKGSCLNNEKEFENAILAMKLNVSQGHLSYSMDHSKWGPMMCPFLFLLLFRNINLGLKEGDCDSRNKEHLSTLLAWHIHKIVEVPFNVVTSMMKSFLKRKLGLMKDTTQSITETLFFQYFEEGVIPSHFSSILDMGQGILHNVSDFYGLISERFINFCIECVIQGTIDSYTSSDDQITLFDHHMTNLLEENPNEFQVVLEFHNYLSSCLNKFVSPKSVVSRLVAEFKSRFFVWGDEVPLLTKFVAASLHNVKCKEPHQLAETIDTIIDQSVANGVPVKLCNLIQERVLDILTYAKFPLDPFLLFSKSDVRDWVDGNRGYRVMRCIEQLLPSGTEKVRSLLRVLYNKLKNGELHEEFTTAYFSQDKLSSLVTMAEVLDKEAPPPDEMRVCWLNLNSHHPIRMVLRQKVVYPLGVNHEEEKIPTIIKTLQNKLSSSFTRGAQKLLSESVNRSAFQSCIASGFVGLCKTLGSKCVRDPEKGVHYIKSVMDELRSTGKTRLFEVSRISLWEVSNMTDLDKDQWPMSLLRPVLWDYMCIALSTSLEIGPWVLGDPMEKTVPRGLKFKSCDYFPLKPHNTRILEDRIGMNHIIYSVRRLYPGMFEKHLLPFMSDLAATKMKWSPRIKFLDLCVVLDVNCEALSLISHVVKWKREEHYTVLAQELAQAHERKHAPLTEERVVSTEEVADNFVKQVYFESYVRPFVATSRTLGSFTWFPHKTSLPASEGLERLGPFSSFVEKVIYKGIERSMYKYDIFCGYSWVDYDIEPAEINVAQLISSGIRLESISSFDDLLDELHTLKEGSVKMQKSIRFTIRSQSGGFCQKFSLTLHVVGSVNSKGSYEAAWCEATFSGDADRFLVSTAWQVARCDDEFRLSQAIWYLSLGSLNEILPEGSLLSEISTINVDLSTLEFPKDEFDFERVGPEWETCPIVVRDGALFEGMVKVGSFTPALHTQDLAVFLEELYPEHDDILLESLSRMLCDRVKAKAHFRGSDIVSLLDRIAPGSSNDILKHVLSHCADWVDFDGYSLCYSKSRDQVMKHTSTGLFRLKGRLCDPLEVQPTGPEDIE